MAALDSTTTDATNIIASLEEQVLALVDHEAWLDAQIVELEYALENGGENADDDIDLESDSQPLPPLPANATKQEREEYRFALEERVDVKKKELATAVTVNTIRTKVIESAHAYQVVLRSLFNPNEQDRDRVEMAKMIKNRDELVAEFLKLHTELQKDRRELAAVQGQVLACQDENRKLVEKLAKDTAEHKDMANSQETGNRKMAQKIEEELKSIMMKFNIVSNVLQGLILESGIDWANDPHWVEVMEKLEG